MGNAVSGRRIIIQFPWPRSAAYPEKQNELDVVAAELRAALARIEALREENRDLKQRQDTLVQEFEQRLVNGVQVIERLLPGQSQAAAPGLLTVEVCPWARSVG